MTSEEMRQAIRSLGVGDEVLVREGSDQRRYFVTYVRGTASPEVDLRGVNGAKRTLVDGVHTIWLRRETCRGVESRRVQDVVQVSTSSHVANDHAAWSGEDSDLLEHAIDQTVEAARTLLRHIPTEYHGWGQCMSEVEVDRLGYVAILETQTRSLLVDVAVHAAIAWIESLDLALGQVRSLAVHGVLGDEPMTAQESRMGMTGLVSTPSLALARATPDSVLLDVSIELARLARNQKPPAAI